MSAQTEKSAGVPYSPNGSNKTSDQLEEGDWKERATPPRKGISRRVKLTSHGHYQVEHAVPLAIVNATEAKWRLPLNAQAMSEQTHLRYSAVTDDPADFTPDNGWTLRTSANSSRSTELLICVTGYNEDRILTARTLHGIMLNIRDICNRSDSKFWRGKTEMGTMVPAWQRIVVASIWDGLDPMDKGVLDLYALLGVYQDGGIMKKTVDGKETIAHIFEYTTQLSVDPADGIKPKLVVPDSSGDRRTNNLVPVQMILLIKQRNQKKINSHRWLLDGIGRQLEPTICVFIDVGTRPCRNSLFHLWSAFHGQPKTAGCCGELVVQASLWKLLTNPLVAAQNFEYKVSNLLDKPMDAAIGFIPVLPGAFSAYRFSALQGEPLKQYFLGDHSLADRLGAKGIHGMSLFAKNMFLAEDRLLCFELVAHKGRSYTLAFVRAAKGETDCPESAIDLIAQRRRWLNGSLAATIYSIRYFGRMYATDHNPLRLFAFHAQLVYNTVVLLFTWFNLAVWWLTFSILINLVCDDSSIYLFGTPAATWWGNMAALWIFALTLGMQFLLALGAKPKTERAIYAISMWIWAILGYYLLLCAMVLTVNAIRHIDLTPAGTLFERVHEVVFSTAGVILAALLSTIGSYLTASLLYLDFWHIFHSFVQYLGLAPSFVLVFGVYAMSNVSDTGWGTKGADKVDALPALNSTRSGGEKVVDELERTAEDLEDTFRQTAMRAVSRHRPKKQTYTPSADEANRSFRTSLLMVWLISNLAVVAIVTYINGYDPSHDLYDYVAHNNGTVSSDPGKIIAQVDTWRDELQRKQSVFFAVVLWTTFFLTLLKLLGTFYFWMRFEILRKTLLCCRGT